MDKLQLKTLGYEVNKEMEDLIRRTRVLFLVGPTGAGKNALESELLKTGLFKRIITNTTRPKRVNHGVLEEEGDEYHFISSQKALDMLDHHEFIEATYIHGYLYGTSIDEFKTAREESKIAVADIDFKGVRSYRLMSDKIVSVFLLPPSFKVLLKRLTARYGEGNHSEDIKVRLTTALDELAEFLSSNFYYGVINIKIEDTAKTVFDILDGKQKAGPDAGSIKLANTLIKDIKGYLTRQANS